MAPEINAEHDWCPVGVFLLAAVGLEDIVAGLILEIVLPNSLQTRYL
jgi:hypothetical protein